MCTSNNPRLATIFWCYKYIFRLNKPLDPQNELLGPSGPQRAVGYVLHLLGYPVGVCPCSASSQQRHLTLVGHPPCTAVMNPWSTLGRAGKPLPCFKHSCSVKGGRKWRNRKEMGFWRWMSASHVGRREQVAGWLAVFQSPCVERLCCEQLWAIAWTKLQSRPHFLKCIMCSLSFLTNM